MIAVEIFIPVASNEGEEFQAEDDAAFELHLLNLFGGMSRLPGLVQGAWIDAGAVYRDQNRVYVVALASIGDGSKIREAVDFAKKHYRQLAIFVRYLGQVEVL
jgi:hypothetical protein